MSSPKEDTAMSALSIPAVPAHSPRRRGAARVMVLLFLVLALPMAALAGPPVITDLGTLPGGIMSLAGSMNAQGQVVGAGDTTPGADLRAFLWDPAAGMQSLGTLGGDSHAHGINGAGQVVGSAKNALRRNRAFIWDAASGMADLGTLPDGSISAAHGINSLAQVAGESNLGGGATFHGFLWSAGGGMQDLGTLPGGSYSVAYAVNDAGQVVGEADAPDAATGDLITRAFLWDPVSGMRDLGTLPGGRSSVARWINADGQVVGWSETAAGGLRAFLWDAVSGMQDLGTLPGGTESRAYGVNEASQVVGEAVLSDGLTTVAFLWDRTGGMQALGTLPGGRRSAAYAINDAGQVLGQADTPVGTDRAVRWQLNRPPSASSQAVTTLQETPVQIGLTATDPDGDALTFTVLAAPAHGSLAGTPPTVTYTPAPGYSGSDGFTFGVSDGLSTSDVATVSITVSPGAPAPSPPGRMHGEGYVESDGMRHHFEFSVRTGAAGEPSGRLRYRAHPRRHGGTHGVEPASVGARGNRFVVTAVAAATFSNDPAFRPGRRPEPAADTVVFSGIGSWNGVPGHTFEARATDAGEPGRARDTFALTITAPDGSVVASLGGTLAGGNIQSKRPKR
ncbi:MAG: DUF3466 family protein [Candidatus Rokubacteria bacterium]|nr:DUF3466 family protein [Candidatus Rokubacteria bacterium]